MSHGCDSGVGGEVGVSVRHGYGRLLVTAMHKPDSMSVFQAS